MFLKKEREEKGIEKENLKKFILESYENWKSGTLNQNAENIEQFSRKNLTQKLVDLMNKWF